MNSRLIICLFAAVATAFASPARAEDGFTPVEVTLRDRAVVMDLAEGVRRVRLRIRENDGTWKLCTVAHLEGVERFLKLRLPDGTAEEDIEVAASFTDPFPYSHYLGQTQFAPTASSGGYYDFRTTSLSGPDDTLAVPSMMVPTANTTDLTTTPEATVEESDIWKWRGDTLYFFNQYRGLQVIDVADPTAPERLATHPVPSGGDQMYLHPSAGLVILLAHDPLTGNGEVVLLRHPSPRVLEEQERIALPGRILESRLIGEILYVVSRHSREIRTTDPETGTDHVSWQSGLSVIKIDLGNPDQADVAPALDLTSDRFNYWASEVQATPRALLISTSAYDATLRQTISTVHVVDIADPAASPAVTHRFPVSGRVLNKFNMHLDGNILTVVSEAWRGETIRQRHASVETFDLAGSAAGGSGPLGSIEFAPNESITATRFVGDLCYVVTFLRIDPLFVVDLSTPAEPRLLGELEIPGFSTYLEPYGEDALISVGVEGPRIAVSWFDVSDSGNPTMTSRVYVGPEDGRSWTEANWDEKAFGVFPGERLILLPFQGSDPDGGRITGVQVIEIGDRELIKRGAFESEFQARRARVLGTAIASISGRSLRTLDISDPDHPEILADLPLAWPADFVHRIGNHLLQLEAGDTYWSSWVQAHEPARLHVGPADDPETLTASLELGPGRVVGSLLHDGCLWVAQTLVESNPDVETYIQTEIFAVTAIDVSDPGAPRIAGRDTWSTINTGYYYGWRQNVTGAILPDGTLCWHPAKSQSPVFYGGWHQPIGISPGVPIRIDFFLPWFSPSTNRVLTVDIADRENPEILASVSLQNSDNRWNEGAFRLVGPVLHHGSRRSVQVKHPDGTADWQEDHWLHQLDLSDPAAPRKQDPVRIPGTFEHIHRASSGGLVAFTSTTESSYVADVWTTRFQVQALAFDGLAAYLLDELVVPDRRYGPLLFDGPWIIVGKNFHETGGARTELDIHHWLPSGSFESVQTLQLPGAINSLRLANQLLIASGSGGLGFIDFADPADPEPASVTIPNNRYWQELALIDLHRRDFAYVPRGMWGVESIDLRGHFPPLLAGYSRDGDLPSGLEWVTIDLDILRRSDANDPMMIGAIDAESTWIVANTAAAVAYDDWVRGALALPADATVPQPDEDTDRDGLSNFWEYHTGTDPGRADSGARPRAFLETNPDGTRTLAVRIFLNPHAPGFLQVESSTDGIHWLPDPNVGFQTDPFSPSLTARTQVGTDAPPARLLHFSFR